MEKDAYEFVGLAEFFISREKELARDIEVFKVTGGSNYKHFGCNKNEIVDCMRKISLSPETALKKNNSIIKNKWETHVQKLEKK
jgi:hypothetical protein